MMKINCWPSHPNIVMTAGPTGSPSWLALTVSVEVANTAALDSVGFLEGVMVIVPFENTPVSHDGNKGHGVHNNLVPDSSAQVRPSSQNTWRVGPVSVVPHSSPTLAKRTSGTAGGTLRMA